MRFLAEPVRRGAALVAVLGGACPVAHAEFDPIGALSTGLLVNSSTRGEGRSLGSGLAVDLWQRFGALRVGIYSGLQIMGGNDADAILFTPLAASLAVVLDAERASFEIRVRGGGYGAALHEVGLSGGIYLGSGVFLDFEISPRASLGVGGELHLLLAQGSRAGDGRAAFSPSLTLVYHPERRGD